MLQVLATRGYSAPADRDALTSWIRTYGLWFTAVVDTPGRGAVTLATYGPRETAFVFDTATMVVLARYEGDTAAHDAMADARRRLGL